MNGLKVDGEIKQYLKVGEVGTGEWNRKLALLMPKQSVLAMGK